jgi:hypothetical protein
VEHHMQSLQRDFCLVDNREPADRSAAATVHGPPTDAHF